MATRTDWILPRLALTGLLLAACSSKPEKPLYGRWLVDTQATVTPEAIGGQPTEARVAAARAEAARISLEVFEDKLVVDVGLDREEARYSAVAGEAGQIVLKTEDGQSYTFELKPGVDRAAERVTMTHGQQTLTLMRVP